jgi:uncharacterized membrane protein
MTGLGVLDGKQTSWAYGVSADGLATVGASDFEAFLFLNGVMIPLGTDGHYDSLALAASNAGAIVVGGMGGAFSPPDVQAAFLWDPIHGMQDLQQVLSLRYGLADELSGWHLSAATAISPDGTAIVGVGVNPSGVNEAWLAILPEPPIGLLLAFGVAGLAAGRLRVATDATDRLG